MKKISFRIFALFLVLGMINFSSCKKDNSTSLLQDSITESQISVVCTDFPCYDFARAVIFGVNDDFTAKTTQNSDIKLKLLIKPGMEVHSFDPTPADIIAIQNADLFIYIGGESDEWVEKILASSTKKPKQILRMMDFVQTLDEAFVEGMQSSAHTDELGAEEQNAAAVDAERNDAAVSTKHNVHEQDEHIWLNSKNACRMILACQESLSKVSVENSAKFSNNARDYCHSIFEITTQISKMIQSKKNATIVVADRFPFLYFATEFGLQYRAAFSGCSSAVEAKTSTIAYLIDFVKQNQIPAVFSIEMSNQKLAKTVAESCNVPVLELHSFQNVTKADFDSGVTYCTIMLRNLRALDQGLR